MSREEDLGDVAAAIAATKELFKPEIMPVGEVEGEKVDVLLVPRGLEVKNANQYLDPLRSTPRRRFGLSTHVTLASLIGITNRFKEPNTALYASGNPADPTLLTVFDYHEPLNVEAVDANGEVVTRQQPDARPRFGDHRAIYHFPVSEEWKAWVENDGKALAQSDFAEFLENRILDVLPAPAENDVSGEAIRQIAETLGGSIATPQKLMELSRGMKIYVDEKVVQTLNLNSGETELKYEQTHNNSEGKPLIVPNLFIIGIPVFKNGALHRMAVRLRYRKVAGSIAWSYLIYQRERNFEVAYLEGCQEAAEKTGVPLFHGAPEQSHAERLVDLQKGRC